MKICVHEFAGMLVVSNITPPVPVVFQRVKRKVPAEVSLVLHSVEVFPSMPWLMVTILGFIQNPIEQLLVLLQLMSAPVSKNSLVEFPWYSYAPPYLPVEFHVGQLEQFPSFHLLLKSFILVLFSPYADEDRKSTRLNSSHGYISYA